MIQPFEFNGWYETCYSPATGTILAYCCSTEQSLNILQKAQFRWRTSISPFEAHTEGLRFKSIASTASECLAI